MKTTRYITICGAALALALSSCVKDTLYNTPHPDKGAVALTVDWTARGEGVTIPPSWTVGMGDYTGTESGTTHAPAHLFDPGAYRIVAYGPVAGITVRGTTATVATASGNYDSVGDFVSASPGWLLTSVQEATIEADRDHEFTAAMRQQVRELTLVIRPTGDAAGRIESIGGYLSGAAGTMDFGAGTHSAASNVEVRFARIAGDDAGRWSATVRLLGVTGGQQRLTGSIVFAEGNPRSIPLESDLTASLSAFNDDKRTPLTLDGTTETPAESGFTATVTDWVVGEREDVVIH